MNVRPGTLKDLNAMTDILIAASPDDPAYDYRFPDRNLYPTVFETVCRQKCREYLENHYVVVCEFSGYGVVAFSVWDLPSKARAAASRRHRPSGVLTNTSIPNPSVPYPSIPQATNIRHKWEN